MCSWIEGGREGRLEAQGRVHWQLPAGLKVKDSKIWDCGMGKKGIHTFTKKLRGRLDKLWGSESALTLLFPSQPHLLQQRSYLLSWKVTRPSSLSNLCCCYYHLHCSVPSLVLLQKASSDLPASNLNPFSKKQLERYLGMENKFHPFATLKCSSRLLPHWIK